MFNASWRLEKTSATHMHRKSRTKTTRNTAAAVRCDIQPVHQPLDAKRACESCEGNKLSIRPLGGTVLTSACWTKDTARATASAPQVPAPLADIWPRLELPKWTIGRPVVSDDDRSGTKCSNPIILPMFSMGPRGRPAHPQAQGGEELRRKRRRRCDLSRLPVYVGLWHGREIQRSCTEKRELRT